MKSQGPYADPSTNSMVAAAQMQMSVQRSQHASEMNRYPGQRESVHSEDDYQYKQWERSASRGLTPVPAQVYREGTGSDVPQSMFHASRSELASEKLNMDPRVQVREQQKEIGYDDNSLPQTFEGLEQRFFEDIAKLIKEHQDAEDAENTRHRERLAEINGQYYEKLLSIRTRQTAHREEFLRKESQARLQMYQEANLSNYQQRSAPGAPHGYGPGGTDVGAYVDLPQMYDRDRYEPYRDRPQVAGADRGRALDSRGPYPGGRVYNSGGRQF